MMIIHSWGQSVAAHDREGFHLKGNGTRISVQNGECILEPDSSKKTFSLYEGVTATYLSDYEAEISGDNLRWVFPGRIRAHCKSHFFGIREKGEEKEYVVMTITGDELFELPEWCSEIHCVENYLIAGHRDHWEIYSLDGNIIYSCEGKVHGEFAPRGRVCPIACFFESSAQNGNYKVFDLARQKVATEINVNKRILGVLQVSENRILVIDHSGLLVISLDDTGIKMEDKHPFEISKNLIEEEFQPKTASVWSDGHCAYIAIETTFNQGVQLLISASLEDGKPIKQISWKNNWSIICSRGLTCNYNSLHMRRQQLMSDEGIMIWPAGTPLSEELFEEALSTNLDTAEKPSEIKGKKTLHIKIQDRSVNNAVRSAASIICRHLGESCKGPYNLAESVANRKFDGKFHVEIWSPQEPNEFEREYLQKLVEYQRYYGGLSPAGSRLGLQMPKVEFHLES